MKNNDKKLIIIGNGFDIAHGLQTTYKKMFGQNKELQSLAEMSNKVMHICIANREMEWNEFEEVLGRMADAYRAPFSTQTMDPSTIRKNIVDPQFDVLHMLEDFARFCEKREGEPANELFNEWDKDEFYRDKTLKIISILIREIKKVYAEEVLTRDEYRHFFDGEHLVINYNYTRVYDEEYSTRPYFSSKDCIHIHGSIVPSTTDEVNTDLDAPNYVEVGEIKLGVYQNQISISTNHHMPSLPIDVSEERAEEICEAFERGIGNTNLNFKKENQASPHDKWRIVDKINFSNFDEIIILGHSMSKNDMERFTQTIKMENVRKITILGYWEDSTEFEVFSEKVDYFIERAKISDETEVCFLNNSPKYYSFPKIKIKDGKLQF